MSKSVLQLIGGLLWLPGLVVCMTPSPADAQDAEAGKLVYDKWCAGCHGDTGAGDGESAAYMLPRPRDFTAAMYQIRTTSSGELPTAADLERDAGLSECPPEGTRRFRRPGTLEIDDVWIRGEIDVHLDFAAARRPRGFAPAACSSKIWSRNRAASS